MPADLLRFKLAKSPLDIDRTLIGLVHDAARNVPFYRNLYRTSGVDVRRFRGASDLVRLPTTTREHLQELPELAHLRRGSRPLHLTTTSTSGSTGQPLTVYFRRLEMYFRRYSVFAALRRHVPLLPPLRIADVGPMVPHPGKTFLERSGALTILRLPGTVPLAEQRSAILRYRPTLLEGYPTCLGLLAESFSEAEARRVRPALVACRSERLSDDTREVLARAFRAPVANLYSCEEVGNLGWECPDHSGRFHLNRDTSVLEVLGQDGRPTVQEGEIVVTGLYNRTMPLVRYYLNDRGRLVGDHGAACSCGATGAALESLSGSEDDFILSPDGRRIAPLIAPNALFNVLRDPGNPHRLRSEIRRYQIVQDADYTLRIILDWRGLPDEALLEEISREVGRASGGLRCTVERSGAFELTAAGKFKEVLCRVKAPGAPSAPTSAG